MAGQIINRGRGVWLARVYLGTDPDTGKRSSACAHLGRQIYPVVYSDPVFRLSCIGIKYF